MVFEAVGPEKTDVEDSLQDHVDSLEEEEDVEVAQVEMDEAEEVKNPHPGLEEGYSSVCEVRLDVEKFSKSVELVINYGPTYVQMEEPDMYEIDLKEGQEMLQSVANTMHQYAQMGAGGVLISRATED